MTRAASREVPDTVEKHHIIPRSLGGVNTSENLAKLTPKEHFIAHLLLTKMVDGVNLRKMVYALRNMKRSNSQMKRVSSSVYADNRMKFLLTFAEMSDEEKANRSNAIPWKGKTRPEHGAKITAIQTGKKKPSVSAKLTGRVFSAETIQKMSEAAKIRNEVPSFAGKKHSEESKKKMSETRMGRKRSPEFVAKMKAYHAAKKAGTWVSV